jgi:hypothetical protein
MDELGQMLSDCTYIFENGAKLTVEDCKFYLSEVRDIIKVRKVINDAYLFEPQNSSQLYRRH